MKQCIVNTIDKDIINKLNDLGYVCNAVIPSERVSPPINAHSDVLYRKVDSNTIIASSCQRANLPLLEKAGYNVIFIDMIKPGYKTESYLNFIINEKYIIRNENIALHTDIGNRKIINVKQGYTSCSTICVTDDAYITDDENIYNTLINNNIDCLKISKGEIELPGYDYGVIGGASVKLNEKERLFFGDFKNQIDKNNVIKFLNKYKVNAIFIENKKLTDIGSALIL